MKAFQLSFLLLAIVVVASVSAKKTDDEEWEEYKKTHGKNHKDAKEESKRKELFLATHRKIAEHNSKANETWKMAHNEFSDWTPEERKQLAGRKSSGQRMIESSAYDFVADEASSRQLPTSLDWRTDICVGPVKNQGSCGSCWAFSSIAPLEFLLCKYRKAYTSLSEQQLVNCACAGCGGGDYYPAWSYLSTTSTGSVANTTLTYKAVQSTCSTYSTGLIKPVTWGTVAANETAIMSALKTYGVLSIAMDVENSFYYYGSGVYSATDCYNTYWDLNHAMAMVGYGTDASGVKYWIIRNSWGTSFGIKGYMLVKRGANMCGVETDVAYVKSNLAVTF